MAAARADDAEENEASEPPKDETVELHCVWLAECYGPSQMGNLLSGIDRLRWDEQGHNSLRPGRLKRWIESARSENAGMAELGHVVRPGDGRWIMSRSESDLPSEVDYARGRLECLFPGLVVFSMMFVLKDEAALSLDRALREEYETVLVPKLRATEHVTPAHRKQEAVGEKRAELRSRCASWFSANVPGVFHGPGSPDGGFPSCELLTVTKAQPFVRLWEEGQSDYQVLYNLYNYMTLLRLDSLWDSFEIPRRPGLLLRGPVTEEEGLALLIAGRKGVVHEHPDYHRYRELAPEPMKMAESLYRSVCGALVPWAVQALLGRYERALAAIQDRVGAIDLDAPEVAAREVGKAQSGLLALSRDVVPLALGIGRLAENTGAFSWRSGGFWRAAEPLDERGEEMGEAVVEAPAEQRTGLLERVRGMLLKPRNDNEANEGPEPPSPPRPRDELMENLRLNVARRSARMQEAEANLRQVTGTIGSAVYAVVQERTNRSNLRLQRLVVALTVVVTVLTVVTAAGACQPERSEAPGPQQTVPSERR